MKRFITFIVLLGYMLAIHTSAFAHPTVNTNLSTLDIKPSVDINYFLQNIGILEKFIEEQGSSVINELYKEKNRIEKLIMLENNFIIINKLQKLLDNYNNIILEYEQYNNTVDFNNGAIVPYGVWHPILSPATATIISYFLTMRYYLAAELLTYAKEESIGGVYVPAFGGYAYDTIEYTRLVTEIRNIRAGSGSSAFPSRPAGGKVKDDDLYYAIHAYNYTYSYTSLTITDKYDFTINPDYEGIAGTAIGTMYMAQVLGVIVPFDVRINLARPY